MHLLLQHQHTTSFTQAATVPSGSSRQLQQQLLLQLFLRLQLLLRLWQHRHYLVPRLLFACLATWRLLRWLALLLRLGRLTTRSGLCGESHPTS